ncbi:MAG: hypothetical protein WDZ51_06710 [Pirellulaceae bacterium]
MPPDTTPPDDFPPREPDPQPVRRTDRFQFRIWQILLVTTLTGILLSLLRVLPYHESLLWFYIPYFSLVGVYVLLRLPMLIGVVVGEYQARAEAKRQVLEAARTRQESLKSDKADPNAAPFEKSGEESQD